MLGKMTRMGHMLQRQYLHHNTNNYEEAGIQILVTTLKLKSLKQTALIDFIN